MSSLRPHPIRIATPSPTLAVVAPGQIARATEAHSTRPFCPRAALTREEHRQCGVQEDRGADGAVIAICRLDSVGLRLAMKMANS
jgi:hypothetical protein